MTVAAQRTGRPVSSIPYAYLVPAIGLFSVFFIYPFFFSVFISFNEWDLISGDTRFVGVANYARLFTDPLFLRVLGNTFLYVIVQTPLSIVLGFFFALMIERSGSMRKLYRVVFFIPVVISVSAASLSFFTMFNSLHGPINMFLADIGIEGPNWLNEPRSAMAAIVIVGVWQSFGYNVILFMSGLKQIDRQLYEAASIDGAGPIRKVMQITIPMLSPVTLFVFVMTTLFSFQVFATVQILTNGGPSNATNVWVYYVWREAFRFFDTGVASAAATLLFVFMLGITILFVRLMQGRVFYR
ncbi:MAG: carbohydrate ABC transporter permease [Alkalispirochaeta sp.]